MLCLNRNMEQVTRIEGNNVSTQGQDQDQNQNRDQNLQHPPPRKCPRCDSNNTKFCYYNNYSHAQPRYFCKACRRYWTHGGTLRNVPVGGGCRKNKRARISYQGIAATNEIATAAAAAANQRYPPGLGNFSGRITGGALRPVVPTMGNFLYPGGINPAGMLNFGGGGNSLLGPPSVKPHVAAAAAHLFQAQRDDCSIFPTSMPPRNLNSWNQRFTGTGSATSSAAGRGFYWNSGNSAGSAFDENKSSEINQPGIDAPPSDE